ncbi:MAG: class D sortase [Ruminococcus sp.]|nr:class D sortase [Ruminococcus sp.]
MSRSVQILLPVLITMLCAGIAILVLMRPYEQLHTYLNIAFMDNMKNPVDENNGLRIVENEIDTTYEGETASEGEAVIPAFGEQYAMLEIEAIDLSVPVYWGSNAQLLERGAVQTTASAVAGAGGNAVIDAHVNTFFRDLNKLETGDTVTLYTQYGRFTYEVNQLIEFKETDKKYVLPTEEEQLTLYTCEMQVFGSSEIRIGAVCKPTEMVYYSTEVAEQ